MVKVVSVSCPGEVETVGKCLETKHLVELQVRIDGHTFTASILTSAQKGAPSFENVKQ